MRFANQSTLDAFDLILGILGDLDENQVKTIVSRLEAARLHNQLGLLIQVVSGSVEAGE